jgi:FkbM family methyltransferase
MLRKILKKLRATTRKTISEDTSPEWQTFRLASTERALERITRRGLRIGTVVDVGASNGSWSGACMQYLPDAQYVLVEAQEEHVRDLESFCSQHANARFFLAAAGNEDGFCYFDDSALFGGLAANEANEKCVKKLPMVRLDTVVARDQLQGPFLLKLDTHGFELQIIHGAEELLRNAELAVIEAYLFRLNDKALLQHELCVEMDKRGFQLVDFSEPMWRNKDQALWQWDLFFVKKTNPVFQSNTYS